MKEKLWTDNTYRKKQKLVHFCAFSKSLGLLGHIYLCTLSFHRVNGELFIQHISFTEWTPLPHSMLERKFTVQILLYIEALTASWWISIALSSLKVYNNEYLPHFKNSRKWNKEPAITHLVSINSWQWWCSLWDY
jgi:hypothetical protein